MDILDGEYYFEEGSVVDLIHQGNKVMIGMRSVILEADEVEDDVKLSEDHTLSATLCLEGIRGICIDEEPFEGKLEKLYDLGTIVELELFENGARMQIHWVNFPPKEEVNVVSLIEIECDKSYFVP